MQQLERAVLILHIHQVHVASSAKVLVMDDVPVADDRHGLGFDAFFGEKPRDIDAVRFGIHPVVG